MTPKTVPQKLCRSCDQVKELDAYLRDARSKDGRRPKCRECRGHRHLGNGCGTPQSPHSLYEQHRERTRQRLKTLRLQVITAYGGRCCCCGIAEPKFLTLDHVREDGAAHRRKVGRGESFYAWLRRAGYPQDDFQLLCANCHLAKSYYGGCPHTTQSKCFTEVKRSVKPRA